MGGPCSQWEGERKREGGIDLNKAHIDNPHGSDLNKYLKPGAPKPEFRKSQAAEPTVEQIQGDNLTSLAKTSHKQFSQEVVDQIYNNDIKGSSFSIKRVMMLEFSQYMENFLGHNFTTEKSSLSLLMSILVIVNESPGSACRPGLRSS